MSHDSARALAAYQDALKGDYRPAATLRASSSSPIDEASAVLLDATVAIVDEAESGPAPVRVLAAAGDATTQALLIRASYLMGLRALFRMDVETLRVWRDVAAKIGADPPPLAVETLRIWASLAGGESVTVAEADALLERATADGDAVHVVECTSQAALVRLVSGDLEGAQATARRASRMAGTEGFLIQEYLANLVLARVRRYSGRAHLSARILRFLEGVVPAPLRPWLVWESAFSGTLASDLVTTLGRRHPATLLGDLLTAAESGDRAGVDASLAALDRIAGSMSFAIQDRQALTAALDATARVQHPWCRGIGAGPFLSVQAAHAAEGSALAYVVANGEGAPRRVLRAGMGLLDESLRAQMVEGRGRKDARTVSAAAELLLAGDEGAPAIEVWKRVYGFEYVKARHDTVFRVLLHRVRHLVETGAILDRVGDLLCLKATRPLVVADPRCNESLDERVLRYLAVSGEAVSAQGLADAVGVSKRSAIDALQRLAGEGTCRKERAQRQVFYRLEDTTFGEPTYARLRGNYPEPA